MNKLKITLNEDGSVYQFAPDFKIMRGSYRNVLINVEVPHSLLLDPATDTDSRENQTGNNVRVGGIISTATGKNIKTKAYEFQRVKDFTRDGTTYRLYQRKMPKIFTMWETVNESEEGQGGSLKLVINVINWIISDLNAKIEEVSASSVFTLDIYPSAYLDEEEDIAEPTDFDELQSQVQEIDAEVDEIKADLYGEDGVGEYLNSKLKAGNKILLEEDNGQIEISVDTINASEVPIEEIADLDANDVQTALLELSKRTDSQQVDTVTGEDDYLVDNTDWRNPIIMHDKSKVDVTSFEDAIETINTNLKSYSLISSTGSQVTLDIDTTNYLMTLNLKNANGTTISSAEIDFPLESMVVGASYTNGTLTLTLQNEQTLDIDISSIINGLVNQSDYNEFKSETENSISSLVETDTSIQSQVESIQQNISSIESNLSAEISSRQSGDENLQNQISNAVLFTEQSLTEEQKKQARTNIGAGDVGFGGTYEELSGKPILNTNNSDELSVNSNETIEGTINLHKVAKTGNFSDLNDIPQASDSQSGIIQIATDDDIKNGTDESKAVNAKQFKNLTNPNLLINGDFKVNQRGETEYSTAGSYTVDRWRMYGDNVTLTPQSTSGIRISYESGVKSDLISQVIECPEVYSGKNLTLSISYDASNATVYAGFTLYVMYGDERVASVVFTRSETFASKTFSFDYSSGSNLVVRLYGEDVNLTSGYIDINYIKLEVGSVATAFSPRPYAEELAMCQRYYLRIKGSRGWCFMGLGLIGSSSNQATIMIPNGIEFRNPSPTITYSSLRILTNGNSAYNITDLTYSGSGNTEHNTILEVTTESDLPTGSAIALQSVGSSAYIDFDCEIY